MASLYLSAPMAPTPTDTNKTPAGPIPMSFPAILRGPGGVPDRFAHLQPAIERVGNGLSSASSAKDRRDDKEGKRWVRRKENGLSRFQPDVKFVLTEPRSNIRITSSSLCWQSAHN